MPRPTIPLDELAAYLFGADRSALAADVGARLAASPRFRAFAEAYRDKIRKKARGLRDDEGRRDLTFELTIAAHLLEERRFALEYESYGAGQRAPDFRVTFRDTLRFNVEVRRLRGPASAFGPPSDAARLIRVICDKLGQLPPAMINVLVLGVDGPSTSDPLAPAMLWLQDRAAQKDELLFKERGFAGTRDFLRHYQRLSGALWVVGEPDAQRATVWRNPQARHPLAADLRTALRKSVT